jgi:hypothetical protein
MKRIFALIVLAIVLFAVPASADQWNKIALPLVIGTTASGTAQNSGIVRIPQAAQIDSVYVTESKAISADDNGLIVNLYLNNAVIGTVSSATALVANTPLAVTPTSYNLAAGDILQAKATKAGTGTTTVDLTVTVTVFSTSSRR